MKNKRLLSFMLSILMVLNMVMYLPWKNIVFAEESAFDATQYKAQLYTTEGKIPYGSIMYYCDEFVSPATDLANQMNSNAAFLASVATWETATFEPKKISGVYIDQIKYYETIIFKALDTYRNSTPVKDIFDNDYVKTSKNLFQEYKKLLEAKLHMEIADIKDAMNGSSSSDYKGEILMSFQESFKKTYPEITDVGKFVTLFSDAVTVGEIGENAINSFASYMSCYRMAEGIKNVIYDLEVTCDGLADPTFKQALANVSSACQSYTLVWNSTLFDVSACGFQFVFTKFTSIMFNAILSAEPLGFGVTIGRAITKPIVNIAFSTDTICEQYYKLNCLKDFESLVKYIVKQEILDYRDTPDNENADTLFSSVELLFNTMEDSCDMADAYAKIVFTNGVASFWAGNQQKYEEYTKTVSDIKEIMQSTYDTNIKDYWRTLLKYEYPDIWEELFNTEINQYAPISVNSISLEQHEAMIDLAEYKIWGMFTNGTFWQMKTTPKDATNRNVSFSSSDTNIVMIDSSSRYPNLYLVPISEGTAIVTVTTEDGGYTDFVEVTVIDDNHNLDGAEIVETGTCGGNLTWTLNSKGTLTISGTGEMDTTDYWHAPWRGDDVHSVIIKDGVRSIGDCAFKDCTSLTRVTIPNSMKIIKSGAFAGCTNLTKVTIPNSVTTIETSAFAGCTSLAETIISDGVITIEDSAFR